jgi:hypothetical protein
MNYRPIFIAGCDRSGTTLLGDLLGKSPWSITTPESQFIHDLLIQIGLGSFHSPEAAAAWLLQHFRYVAWDMPLTLRELADLIDLERPRATIENLIARYAQLTHPDKHGADVWIDHTPDNFKYQAMLKRLFPEARFIHIVRDGRAVCASIKPLNWGPNNAYTASRHWSARLQEAMVVEVAEGDNCLRVRFEDLLSQPEEVIRRICGFIDLPFDASLLNGGGLMVPTFSRDQHRLVGKPLDRSRADDWRRKLSVAEIRDFESHPLAHTLLNRMGYQTRSEDPPHLSSLRILGRYCHEFVHYMLHRRHHRTMEARAISAHRNAINRSLCQPPALPVLADGHTAQASIHD